MTREASAPWRDEELLRQKYVEERMQPKDIIEELGCSRTTFYDWVEKFGLKEEREKDTERPWRDEDTLRELYVEEGMSVFEVGDELGCSGSAVQRNLEKVGIGTRDVGGNPSDAPYKIESKMRERYVEDEMSTWEIAEEWGVSQATICKWLDRHEIEKRKSNWEKTPTYYTRQNGYEYVMSGDKGVFVHQLVAVANGADPYKVMGDLTNVVHHKKEIPWLNTRENLELTTQSEHRQIHGNQYTD